MVRRKLFVLLSILVCVAAAYAADVPMGTNIDQMTFGSVPGLPTCIPGSLVKGDPTSGAFIVYAKAPAGCVVPGTGTAPASI